MKQLVLHVALAAAVLVALAGCGKRGPLEQPEGVQTSYPRTYPTK